MRRIYNYLLGVLSSDETLLLMLDMFKSKSRNFPDVSVVDHIKVCKGAFIIYLVGGL